MARCSVRGLTLLEVMLAVTLLLVLFLGAVGLLPSVSRSQADLERQELAALVGDQVLADARSRPFPALASLQGTAEMPLTAGGVERVERFTYQLEVVALDDTLRDVVVTVSTDGEPLVLQTRIFEEGASGP